MDEKALYANFYSAGFHNPVTSKSMERGKLLSKKYYNNGKNLVKEVMCSYDKAYTSSSPSGFIKAPTQEAVYISSEPGLPGWGITTSMNLVYTYRYLESSRIETEYNPETNIPRQSVTTNTTYNSSKLIKSVETFGSDGKGSRVEYKYPCDYNLPIQQGVVHPVKFMQMKNIIGYPIEQKKFVNNLLTEAKGVAYGYINESNSIVKQSAVYRLNTDKPILDISIIKANIENNNYVVNSQCILDQSFTYYDNGNIKEIFSNKDNKYSTLIWGYSSHNIIAEIENSDYNSISKILTNNTIENLSYSPVPNEGDFNELSALRSHLPNAFVTCYTYIPTVGVDTKTDSRGITTHFAYDKYQKLSAIRDFNKNILEHYDYKFVDVMHLKDIQIEIDSMGFGFESFPINKKMVIGKNYEAVYHPTGGHGKYEVLWILKDGIGNIVQSSTTTRFGFNYPISGNMTIELTVKDLLGGIELTKSRVVTFYNPEYVFLKRNSVSDAGINYLASLENISGGSGQFHYSWFLKDKSGIVLKSELNTVAPEYVFSYSTTDKYSVECQRIDLITGEILFHCLNIPAYSPISASIFLDAPPISKSNNNIYTIIENQYLVHQVMNANLRMLPGGSGFFKYFWTFRMQSNSVDLSLVPVASFELNHYSERLNTIGDFIIQCQIEDVVFGDIKTVSRSGAVVPNPNLIIL